MEAGTGVGRILFAMQDLGFSSLVGFDYIPDLIEQARKRDSARSIRFEVQDAISLNYEDASFDQIFYSQQILCLIEKESPRLSALREAYRILRPGGTALLSFLSFEAKEQKYFLCPIPYLPKTLEKRERLQTNHSVPPLAETR
jgi:ubiquinone/menaquinone biosynthesis C-methylase UbiE